MTVLEQENSFLKDQIAILTSINNDFEKDYREIENKNYSLEEELHKVIREKQMMEKFCSDNFIKNAELSDRLATIQIKYRTGKKMRDYLASRLKFAIALLTSLDVDFKLSFKNGDLKKY